MFTNNILLLGKTLTHSFSKQYFQEKFQAKKYAQWNYDIHELADIGLFNELKSGNYLGFNVTIPYKQSIIPFLDYLDISAQKVGAVNTIKVVSLHQKKQYIGYNTDYPAFSETIKPFINTINEALILGNGGAAKAIIAALNDYQIPYQTIARNAAQTFENLKSSIIQPNQLIINCTPLGMFPNQETFPNIPYQLLNKSHILYDLVYNPDETLFLKKGKEQGTKCISGLKMLHLQADLALKIWENDAIIKNWNTI